MNPKADTRDPWNSRAGRQLRAEVAAAYRAANAPCWLCGQPIDYDAPAHDPNALDIDHVKARKPYPHLALDRSNLRPSHCRCNRSRGVRDAGPGLGEPSEDW